MKILGIDYGKKKIGLAYADGILAEPLKVIRFENESQALEKASFHFALISRDKKVEKIVIGISEGMMAKETREFGKKLEEKLKIPVIFQDETLSTQEAQKLSIEAGIKRRKRKKLEDAYSATLILQHYIDVFNLT